MKQKFKSLARWGWFCLLVLFAFGYLVAGLSRSGDESKEAVREMRTRVAGLPTAELSQVVSQVNHVWQAELDSEGIRAADSADWLTVCRRMSLAMVGSGLSLEEIRQLELLPEQEREAAHLENLLNDGRFHSYWAERWARFLVGTDEGQFVTYRRRRFRIWLTETFAENWRYDHLVRTLLESKGLWTDQPQVNFLTATFDSNDGQPDPVRLAARTSRAFLGLRIDCLQCHDDFLGNVSLGDVDQPREGTQQDFHQLAAFFTAATNNGLQGVKDQEVDYQYKFLEADEEVAVEADVPYREDLLPTEGNARDRLAKWITHPENRQVGKAVVSRVWALLFGRPMGTEVDNLPLDESCSPMLDVLADDFLQNGFDLRRLIRLIVGSQPFRVDSRASFEITPAHEDTFAVFPLVRLRPEQVAGAVIQSARVKKTDRDSSLFVQLQTLAGNSDFVKRYGDMGEDEFNADSITITQRLLVMNGKMVSELVKHNPVLNTSAHAAMYAKDTGELIDTLYLACLNRYPSEAERAHFISRIDEAESRDQAVEDVVWVLINSSEMAWNH